MEKRRPAPINMKVVVLMLRRVGNATRKDNDGQASASRSLANYFPGWLRLLGNIAKAVVGCYSRAYQCKTAPWLVEIIVAQAYKVDVEVLAASRGCTAILRCVVPNFVKELVRVVSWVQEPAFYIYPSLQGDGKYHLLPTGELLIHNLEYNDRYPSYRCRTMHKLTRQVVTSNSAKIRMNGPETGKQRQHNYRHNQTLFQTIAPKLSYLLTRIQKKIPALIARQASTFQALSEKGLMNAEQRGIVSPSVVEHTSHVAVSQDEGAVLLCVAQGCPSPEYRTASQQLG
uniref:Ig-like domain-containing protein n=1 Tax=Anopheles culicifacies TaxID=139723 RepID=A0A182MAK7_9DIPT